LQDVFRQIGHATGSHPTMPHGRKDFKDINWNN